MIVITGAGGFIGSVVLGYLNKQGIDNAVLFDDLPSPEQFKNLINKKFKKIHSSFELENSKISPVGIEAVIHLGANSNTLEKDWASIYRTNVLSTRLWNNFCKINSIPLIFTSTAAVYGNGSGPLNHYAFSKLASEQEIYDKNVILRLFNVYGPNEYHKGRMASTMFHWYDQIQTHKTIKLFKNSERYLRDFIWVEDVAKVILFFIQNYKPGIYDLGTGLPASFEQVAEHIISNVGYGTKEYIDMPEDLKLQYQEYTSADVTNLVNAGYDVNSFMTIDNGLKEYITYLGERKYY